MYRLLVLGLFIVYTYFALRKTTWITNKIQPVSYTKGIPNIIYRTAKSLHFPSARAYSCHTKWLDLNPGYNMIWYGNEECDSFMAKHYSGKVFSAYQRLKPGAYKADLWRLCILHWSGGIYVDAYATPHVSFAKMLAGCYNTRGPQFISVLDCAMAGYGIHNGFIIAEKGHPFLAKAIDDIVANVEKRFYGTGPLDITGPLQLARSISSVTGISKHKVGRNLHGVHSYYLFDLYFGINQDIFKWETKILSKYYSFLDYIAHKLDGGAYAKMWHRRKVYGKGTL